jgi:hypothetical protein
MYRQFNIQKFYVLPTKCIYVFCADLRTNSDYFVTYHQLVLITECVYCAVQTGPLDIPYSNVSLARVNRGNG